MFVPEHRTYKLLTRTPQRESAPLHRLGILPVVAAGHGSWALGVAKSMLDDVATLAKEKVRMSDMETLALRQTFQRNLSHHTGMWRAARAGLIEAFTTVEAAAAAGNDLTPAMRADLRSGRSATCTPVPSTRSSPRRPTSMPPRSTSGWSTICRASDPASADGRCRGQLVAPGYRPETVRLRRSKLRSRLARPLPNR